MKNQLCAITGTLLLLSAVPMMATPPANEPGTPATAIVTAEAKRGRTIPPLMAEDVAVKEGKDKRIVTSLTL